MFDRLLSTLATLDTSDRFALYSLIVALAATILALAALRRGNRNSSIASMIPLNSELREMWDNYIAAFPKIEEDELLTAEQIAEIESGLLTQLANLMNVLEIAAAIEVEGTLSGVSRILMRDVLQRLLSDILGDQSTSEKVSSLLQDENTFYYIRRFLRKTMSESVTYPPNWYAYPKVSVLDRAKTMFRY